MRVAPRPAALAACLLLEVAAWCILAHFGTGWLPYAAAVALPLARHGPRRLTLPHHVLGNLGTVRYQLPRRQQRNIRFLLQQV